MALGLWNVVLYYVRGAVLDNNVVLAVFIWLVKYCWSFSVLTKWFSPTRLETRTKESNIYASIWVSQTLMHNESKSKQLVCWGGIFFSERLHHRPNQSLAKGLSKSIDVGTRKMVNYAWTGRSQGKLWWRLVAILTCKSFVWSGYRGERLIEPSSSWFPPKFPSG